MKHFCTLLFTCAVALIFTHALAATVDPHHLTFVKNTEEQLSFAKQQQLRTTAPWREFSARHQQWKVIFDERTGMPHRSYGDGIAITTPGDAKDKALAFIISELSAFGISSNDLVFRNQQTSKYHYVDFYQKYQELEILSSRVTVRMTLDNRVILFGADVFNDIQISTLPAFSASTAGSHAASGISYTITGVTVNPEMKILAVPVDSKYEYHLVYEVKVHAVNADSYPARYYTLVDAHSGEVLYRQNEVCELSATVTTEGTVSDPHPYEPTVVHKLPYLNININGTDYYTNGSGSLELPTITSATSATVYLQGTWSKVVSGNTSNAVSNFTTTINPGSNTVSFDGHADLEEISAYHHVNVVHDYMKQYLPSYMEMDESLETRVERTDGSCNAFYDGGSINFYTQSDGCYDLALAGDVVYHEYGHGIEMRYYDLFSNGLNNGAINEGYSDVWAIAITDNPILGIGISDIDPNAYVRRYDINKKVYPQDIQGEVHADGEIIAGCWYDTRLNLGNVSSMMTIFAEALSGLADGFDGQEGTVFRDVLLDALTADDDDANLTNGTPHDMEILSAFAIHGITLIGEIVLIHNEPLQVASSTPINIQADITVGYPIYLGDVYLHYKSDIATQYDSVPMTLLSGSTYQASIPSQPKGTIIDYYFSVGDVYGSTALTKPFGVHYDPYPNLPYKLLCGFILSGSEDFDNTFGDWVFSDPGDNALTGQWIVDSPNPSFVSGNQSSMVQTGTDHTTTGIDLNQCAFTGNANNGEGAGANDVDEGRNTMYSPAFDLSEYENPAISYYRWFSNDQGATPGNDPWRVYISNDLLNWVPVEHTHTADHSWRNMAFRVSDYVSLSSTVQLKFVASDSLIFGTENNGQSLVEGAIDDLYLWEEGEQVGINEVLSNFSFDVFPNPATDAFTVQLSEISDEEAILELINNLGQVVYTQTTKNADLIKVSVKNLPAGSYLIRMQSEEGSVVAPVQVQH